MTLATFKQLLDRLLEQKADIEGLLPASSIDIITLNVAGLKQALLPWPLKRLAELHQALPVLAAGGQLPGSRNLLAPAKAALVAVVRQLSCACHVCFGYVKLACVADSNVVALAVYGVCRRHAS